MIILQLVVHVLAARESYLWSSANSELNVLNDPVTIRPLTKAIKHEAPPIES